MFRKIVVGLNGSDAATRALRVGLDLARATDGTVQAVGVEEHLPHYAATVGEIQEEKAERDAYFARVMSEAKNVAEYYGVRFVDTVVAGDAARQIIATATRAQADLIVLGAKGHGIIRDFLLGTTTDRVTHHAPCSVLVVR